MVDAVTPYSYTHYDCHSVYLPVVAGRPVPLVDVLGAELGVARTKLGQVTLREGRAAHYTRRFGLTRLQKTPPTLDTPLTYL